MDTQLVATNSQTMTLHKAGSVTTACGLASFRKANAKQLASGRRCPKCFTLADIAKKTPTAKKAPARKAAPAERKSTVQYRSTADYTWRLDAHQLEATREKVSKINARAERHGLDGRLTIKVEEVEETTTDEETGFEVTEIKYDVTIGGTAPAFDGWQFLATLDWDEHAGLVVRPMPGAPVTVDRSLVKEGWCGHCNTNRSRRITYVMLDMNTGQQIQVGRSCIKDFTGWQGNPAFLEDMRPTSEWAGGSGLAPREVSPEDVLAIAWACIKLRGFVPTSHHWDTPTAALVRIAINPNPKSEKDKEFARSLRPLAEEARGQAKKILAWVRSDAFRGDSDYVTNLKAVAAGKLVSNRNIGLMASAPQAYARHMEKTLVRERQQADLKDSRWMGEVKERLELTVEVKTVRFLPSDYSDEPRVLYTLRDEATGNYFKWFATGEKLGEAEGGRFVLRGTVKKHDEWEGLKTTLLTNCRVRKTLTPVPTNAERVATAAAAATASVEGTSGPQPAAA